MPTYSYECSSCKKHLSVFQKMSDPKLKDCDHCKKKDTLKRLISGGAGMVFKGTGFYLTDYTSYGKNSQKDKKDKKNKKEKSTKKD